jgi:hypothetical protein
VHPSFRAGALPVRSCSDLSRGVNCLIRCHASFVVAPSNVISTADVHGLAMRPAVGLAHPDSHSSTTVRLRAAVPLCFQDLVDTASALV